MLSGALEDVKYEIKLYIFNKILSGTLPGLNDMFTIDFKISWEGGLDFQFY